MPDCATRDARLLVHQAQAEDNKIDVGTLKADILADIVRNNQQSLQQKDTALMRLQEELDKERDWKSQANAVALEFEAQYPQCGNALVGRAWSTDGDAGKPIPFLHANCRRLPARKDAARVTAWLKARTGSADVKFVMTPSRGLIVRKDEAKDG